ncbi:MAG: prepilin-type N-terminal cleavage/methylation domain-containing protein [Clostridium sp.]
MKKLSIKSLKGKAKKKGFTLIELIIVIAIIAILAAMAIPKFVEIKESANKKADIATGKNIATAVATVIADGNNVTEGSVNNNNKTTDEIAKKLDGDLQPKSENAKSADSFSYKVSDGNIKVSYGSSYDDSAQVYPDYKATK